MKNRKIKSIQIDSFRAFADKIDLNFEVNDTVADIVVVYAANGTGKTSTIEGVEWATTGSISRLHTIFSNNKGNKKNPKEGYILKNRQSTKAVGSVSIELDDGTKIHRQTKPKLNRNNDYCEGKILNTVDDVEYFSSNILSQGTISKFSYEASSGGLFNSLLDKVESKEDIEIYNKLNETKSAIEKNNNDIKVEISLIDSLISKEVNEVNLIKNDYVERSNFQESKYDTLLKENFSFYEGLSLKSNDEIISHIREVNNKLDILKDKLNTFDVEDYRNSVKKILISSNIIELRKKCTLKENNSLKLKDSQQDLERKKRLNSLFLGDVQLVEINKIIKSNNYYQHLIEKYNNYLDKISKINGRILTKGSRIDLLTLREKSNKLNSIESLLLSLFVTEGDSNFLLPEKSTIFDEITNKIQDKNDQLNSVTRSAFIKLNDDIDEVSSFKKKLSSLENVNIKIKELISEKEKTVSFDEKIKLINTYANEVINEKQLNECPACGNKYDSVEELLATVSNFKSNANNLIDGSISTLTEHKNELVYDIDNLTKAIDNHISEKRKLIQEKIDLLTERMQKLTDVYSLLDEFDINYENIHLKQVFDDLLLKKDTIKHVSSKSHKLKKKYTAWSVKISEKIKEVEGKLNQNKLNVRNSINSCFSQFDVDIEELILISGSYHVLLFKQHQFNSTIGVLENDTKLIDSDIKSAKNEILDLCSKAGFSLDTNINEIREEAIQSKHNIRTSYNYIRSNIKTYTIPKNDEKYSLIASLQEELSSYLSHIDTSQQLATKKETISSHKRNLIIKKGNIKEGNSNLEKVQQALESVNEYFTNLASECINNEVLTDMFMYIEPHLKYDEISFKVELDGKNKGIYIQAKSSATNEKNTPVYYLSEAQTNILSICIFLANHARESDTCVDTIIIDDPVQSMDDLNSYALIDLCKIFARRFNKQIIITTHNRSFYSLFKDKLPESRYPTKFISL